MQYYFTVLSDLYLLKKIVMHSFTAFDYNEKLSLKFSNSLMLGLFKALNDNRIVFYQMWQLSKIYFKLIETGYRACKTE